MEYIFFPSSTYTNPNVKIKISSSVTFYPEGPLKHFSKKCFTKKKRLQVTLYRYAHFFLPFFTSSSPSSLIFFFIALVSLYYAKGPFAFFTFIFSLSRASSFIFLHFKNSPSLSFFLILILFHPLRVIF